MIRSDDTYVDRPVRLSVLLDGNGMRASAGRIPGKVRFGDLFQIHAVESKNGREHWMYIMPQETRTGALHLWIDMLVEGVRKDVDTMLERLPAQLSDSVADLVKTAEKEEETCMTMNM